MDSQHTKARLMGLHKNIIVLRHPKTTIPMLWSHHEKMVIVDKRIGFLGGIDLCYGRYDQQKHPLFDFSENLEGKRQPEICNIDSENVPRMPWHDIQMMVMGEAVKDMVRHFIQYWNFAKVNIYDKDDNIHVIQLIPNQTNKKVKDVVKNTYANFKNMFQRAFKNKGSEIRSIENGENNLSELQSEEQNQRMALARGLKKSFIQIKGTTQNDVQSPRNADNSNYSEKQEPDRLEQYIQTISKKKRRIKHQLQNGKNPNDDSINLSYESESVSEDEEPQENLNNYMTGVDLGELGVKDDYSQQDDDDIQIKMLKKLQQIEKREANHSEIKYFIAQNKEDDSRNNNNQDNSNKANGKHETPNKNQDSNRNLSQNIQDSYESNSVLKKHILNDRTFNVPLPLVQKKQYINLDTKKNSLGHVTESSPKLFGNCHCQILRSASNWSIGLKTNRTEQSIHLAYIKLISESKKYIYIENQFFISYTAGPQVQNLITEAIYERIKKAIHQKEKFFVVVVMPLLPGFAGEINDSSSAVMKCQLHWEYETICRGKGSLLKKLSEICSDPSEYIYFYGLRTHTFHNNVPQTEMIYVHSKIMIVDDDRVIIGSANINDRSMLGNRDSELAILIEDQMQLESRMAGKPVKVGEFAWTLRNALYQEHFQLTEEEAFDPMDFQLMNRIRSQVKQNTQIYREIFRCYPDDQVTKISHLSTWQQQKRLDKYQELSPFIKGFAVEFPLDFLSEEDLKIQIYQKEFIVPDENFL